MEMSLMLGYSDQSYFTRAFKLLDRSVTAAIQNG
jgi:hypothetical protein